MSEVLHLMLLSSDALTVECDVRHVASDAEIIRCTDEVVLMSVRCCTRFHRDQMTDS